MNKSEVLILAFIVLFVSLPLMTIYTMVGAKSDGIAGYSTAGCTCHSPNPSPSVSVFISGQTVVIPNATYTYTVTVTGGPLASNGLDVSVTNGTLVVTDSTNTLLLSGEVTQTSVGASQTSWSFDWTTPSTYGNVTMYLAGFSGDGDGRKDADDLWNTASLTIIVTIAGDLDGDGDVDWFDFGDFAAAYGSSIGQPNYNPLADLDADGDVDWFDFGDFAANYGRSI